MKKKIVIILGSSSDRDKLKDGFSILEELKIPYDFYIISAHRNPDKLRRLCKKMEKNGTEAVIACAGLAAALGGFIASYVDIPVIGVPLKASDFNGLDSLLSIIQIPRGLGILSSGFDVRGFINALIFALEIVALGDKTYKRKLKQLKGKFKK